MNVYDAFFHRRLPVVDQVTSHSHSLSDSNFSSISSFPMLLKSVQSNLEFRVCGCVGVVGGLTRSCFYEQELLCCTSSHMANGRSGDCNLMPGQIVFFEFRSTFGGTKAVFAPRRMTLARLFQEIMPGSIQGGPERKKERSVLHGFICGGRYVGRLEATLEEAGVQSGGRIEVVLGRLGGVKHGSTQAKGQCLP